jgi:hypothetical protein
VNPDPAQPFAPVFRAHPARCTTVLVVSMQDIRSVQGSTEAFDRRQWQSVANLTPIDEGVEGAWIVKLTGRTHRVNCCACETKTD